MVIFFLGPMALGYRYEAKEWSEKTHHIPIEDQKWTCTEKDKLKIFGKIITFVTVIALIN